MENRDKLYGLNRGGEVPEPGAWVSDRKHLQNLALAEYASATANGSIRLSLQAGKSVELAEPPKKLGCMQQRAGERQQLGPALVGPEATRGF